MKPISRAEARVLGLKRFYTGQPCKFGHLVERLVSNKACIACGNRKSIIWAAKNAQKLNRRARERHAANPKRRREYERGRYSADPRPKMLANAKQRAKRAGIEFTITINDITIPAICPLLGIPLTVGDGTITNNSPTIDRIWNDRGYIRGNVIMISHLANRAKQTLTSNLLLRLAINLQKLEQRH